MAQRLSPLTVMPLGILGSAVLCDFGAQLSGFGLFGDAGFYNMAAGLIVSFVALLIVLVDLVTELGQRHFMVADPDGAVVDVIERVALTDADLRRLARHRRAHALGSATCH